MDNQADFDLWIQNVDSLIVGTVGIGIDDLPDAPYRAWFDQQMRPSDAAMAALESSGFEPGE